MKNTPRILALTAALASTALALSACGQTAAQGEDNTVSIGYVPWDEVTAVTYLWEHILEEEGYEVELTQLDPAAVYAAVAQNDTDLFLAAIPETQGDYWDQFGDNFESVTEWYQPLRHGIVVPEYVEGETIEDLTGRADEFGGEIIGIEPGAGLMKEMAEAKESYDLEGYSVVEGSTAAMLAAFERAVANEKPIVATAWNPHWAVDEYGMKFLEDSRGIFTDGGVYHVIASEEAQGKEELISTLKNFKMTDEELFPLLTELRDAGSGNEAAAVDAWLEDPDHQALVDSWVGTE